MVFVKGVPRGWLQTSPMVEFPIHDGGLHKNQISQHFLHGSWVFLPKCLLDLSVPQQAKGHKDSVRACHGIWDLFTALPGEQGVEVDLKALTAQCCLLCAGPEH